VAGTKPGAGAVPVVRGELTTRDMGVIADLISRRYVEHRARFRCDDPAQVDAGAQSVTAGLLEVAFIRYQGFDYHAEVSPPDDFLGLVTLRGTGTLTAAGGATGVRPRGCPARSNRPALHGGHVRLRLCAAAGPSAGRV
jgi:hypothetical protein